MSTLNLPQLSDQRVRGWLYLIAAGVGAVLVLLGAIRGDGSLLGLGLPMLGFGLPAYHTPRRPELPRRRS